MGRNKIKKYFNKSLGREWLLLAVFGWILNLLAQFQDTGMLNLISIITIVLALFLFIKDSFNFAKRLDLHCQGISLAFYELKKRELPLSTVTFDLIMENYLYDNPFNIKKVRCGFDRKWRSSAYETCILFFW